jgi:hypothetical protein
LIVAGDCIVLARARDTVISGAVITVVATNFVKTTGTTKARVLGAKIIILANHRGMVAIATAT